MSPGQKALTSTASGLFADSSGNELTMLADHHPPRGLELAATFHKGRRMPFLTRTMFDHRSSRNVYLTQDGKRPSCLTQAQLVPRCWKEKYLYWTLDLNGDRIIVKGWPNNGIVQGAKWTYFAWSTVLKGFEQQPIALSTIGNDPENKSHYVKNKYEQKLQASDPKETATADLPTEYISDASQLGDDDYETDTSIQSALPSYCLRRNPLPDSWLEAGHILDQSRIGLYTSDEQACSSESESESTDTSSDTDSELETPKVKPNLQNPKIDTITNAKREHSEAIVQTPKTGEDEGRRQIHANLPAYPVVSNGRKISALVSRPHMPGTARSLMMTIRGPLARSSFQMSDDNDRKRLDSDMPVPQRPMSLDSSSTPSPEVPLLLTRPTRMRKPTSKTANLPSPVATTRKHKVTESSQTPSTKKLRSRGGCAAAADGVRSTVDQNPPSTLKPTGPLFPNLTCKVPKMETTTPILSAYKQQHTTLRVRTFDGIVSLKLRSCITTSTLFASIISAIEDGNKAATYSTIRVTFDWKASEDPKKTICVKKGIIDSFEVFLEIIDEAPCWKEDGGKCEVAIEVLAS